jgi:hypothetical protein
MVAGRLARCERAAARVRARAPFGSATTVGLAAPTARMAPWFGGRIAVKASTPIMPKFEIVKVPEEYLQRHGRVGHHGGGIGG